MTFLLIASFSESIINFRGDLIKALISREHVVHISAPGLTSNSHERSQIEAIGAIAHDIPMQRNGTNPIFDFGTMVYLWWLQKKIKPDILLAYTIKPIIYGLISARLLGIEQRFALITGLGYSFVESTRLSNSLMRFITRNLYALALHKATTVFFQNNDDRAFFLEQSILTPTTPTCVVNGSGVDTKWFKSTPLPKGPSFLLIARLLGSKGVREYAKAAAIVKQKYPTVVFFLGGWIDPGPDAIDRSELDTWITDGTLQHLGKLTDVRSAISQCSVYVLPSYREGTPRTVLEAMSMGRAIITTDTPGCRDTITDHYNGRLVAVRDVRSLADAMFDLIENPALVKTMGERSRQIAMARYDVHKVNAAMINQMGIL